jgi:hypothetical protein
MEVVVKRPAAEDVLLIHELYARYSWALDTGNTEDYVRLFLPSATVYESTSTGVNEAMGHDAIRAFVLRFHGNPEFPGRQHRISQIVIDPDPQGRPDHWLVRSYVLTTETAPGAPPTLFWSGCAFDTVAKVAGEWRIAEREIRPWAGEQLERFALGG